jgi:arabinose-5-phosphate isomerase
MIVSDDVLLAISYGGETEEILHLIETAKRLGVKIVALTGNVRSSLAAASEVALDISVKEEACSLNLAPTASTTAALAMGDALAIALLERRGFQEEDFARLHPGGVIGKRLRRVGALMHSGADVPKVSVAAKMPDVIYEMSKKGLGMAAVVEDGDRLAGIITDGDLRRLMQKRKGETFDLTAHECMTANPATISPDELAATALNIMEKRKITALIVVDSENRVAGVVHLHDLWTLQLF